MLSWSHKRPEEAQKGRENRGYRRQGPGGGCWRLGSRMGCKGACGEKKMFETLTSEGQERQKYTDTSESEKQKGIRDLGGPARPRKPTVELGPELTVPLCKTSPSGHRQRNTDEKGRKAGQARAGRGQPPSRLTRSLQSCSLLLNGCSIHLSFCPEQRKYKMKGWLQMPLAIFFNNDCEESLLLEYFFQRDFSKT